MKLNKKDAERRLEVWPDKDGFVLAERVRYVPIGYTKAKWSDDRIFITAEEIAKLAEFAKSPQS